MRLDTFSGTLTGIVFLALVFLPGTTKAEEPSATEILAGMQEAITGFKDQTMDVTMTVTGVDGKKKSYDFTVVQKGVNKRLIRFTSGEMKGMATLIESRGRVHVYLPGMNKVRRVASHAMNQSFAGSDFTTDDMASLNWSGLYDAKLTKADETHWHLDCTGKADKKVPYSRVVIKVNRKGFRQDSVEYYDGEGKKIKTLENSRPKTFPGGLIRNSKVLMTDARTEHSTQLDVHSFRVDEGLSDSRFTVRQLQWGQ